ncbi:DUF721 domain-containing protein [Coraliomargarita parva]|uniref:DUF721 domain-containing protein n=1 Tax=Coraliomargarita parva TaxID=3014050 RepID=UPI0022B4257E|nr:DUF721 domain-containing protein [Coraliomargarita parva]
MKFSKQIDDMIADFRGLPRDGESTSSRRVPVALENLIVVLEEQYKLEKPSPERSLVENWEAIFGPSLAARCHPVRIKNGTLVISVTNPTLRSEVNFRKRGILRKIQELDYCADITDIVTRG